MPTTNEEPTQQQPMTDVELDVVTSQPVIPSEKI